MNKIKRIKELTKLLNHYRDEYYNNSISKISDFEYDKLFDELSALESETGFTMSISPTISVGYEVKSKLEKIKHSHSMLSLGKTKSVDELKAFAGSQDCILSLKMDGLTVLLTYEDGQLVQAETRGNGEEGEIITHNARVFENIPLYIDYKGHLEVEGEAIITYDDFEKINSLIADPSYQYKNPRNLVSGSVRQLDSNIASQRHIRFIAWKVPTAFNDFSFGGNNSFLHRLLYIKGLGFEVVPYLTYVKEVDDADTDEMIEMLKDTAKNLSYPIDGLVMTYNDISYGESLGMTGHHPKHSIAFKFYDEVYPTKLQYIDWTIGKSSQLTPTAVFEGVEIDGTDVSRASLHNISIIKNLGLTNGCTVNIFKANQIIPQIDSCENDGDGEIEIPTTCPVCGGATAINKDNESEVLICTNPDCSGKMLAKFVHFVSRKCMNIEGLSEATLDKLISLDYINDFQSIYHLSNYHDQLIKLDGLGAKSVEKLLLSIEKSRNVKLENFIAALGIPNIGLAAAKTISKKFNGNFYDWMDSYVMEYPWDTLDDFGEIMANSINTYLAHNYMAVIRLSNELHFIEPDKQDIKDNYFAGKSLCVTGKLNHFTRDSINEKIVSLGAKAVGSVSKSTSYLITNEASGSSKYKKAIELGVPIITEEEFLKMCGE